MTNMGIFITQLLGYFLSHGQMWRVILAAAGVIGLIQLAGLTLAIDSPKWRADQGQAVQAKRDLQRIRGHGVDIQREVEGWGVESACDREGIRSPYLSDALLSLANRQLEEEETLLNNEDRLSHHSGGSNKGITAKKEVLSIFEVLWIPDYNRAIIAVVAVMLAQQLCGMPPLYSSSLANLSPQLSAGQLPSTNIMSYRYQQHNNVWCQPTRRPAKIQLRSA
jgi:MFS family permease